MEATRSDIGCPIRAHVTPVMVEAIRAADSPRLG